MLNQTTRARLDGELIPDGQGQGANGVRCGAIACLRGRKFCGARLGSAHRRYAPAWGHVGSDKRLLAELPLVTSDSWSKPAESATSDKRLLAPVASGRLNDLTEATRLVAAY